MPALRGGRPVIRGVRITVGDVLGRLAAGMSEAEIREDFPALTGTDIRAALAVAAARMGAPRMVDEMAEGPRTKRRSIGS